MSTPYLQADTVAPVRASSRSGRGGAKLVLCLVGLPARGKTYMARKLSRYLNWLGFRCKVFNIGNYRRATVGKDVRAAFFDPSNAQAQRQRNQCAVAALDDMFSWLDGGAECAIYDGTNSTKERRMMVLDYFEKHQKKGMRVQLVWLESICNDPAIIENNIVSIKTRSPDYTGADKETAVADFKRRIAHYESVYETLDDDSQSYVKVIDTGRQVVSNRINGYLASKVVFFLMNLTIKKHEWPIFLSRHGQSEFNVRGLIGGDSPLTERGRAYADMLAKFISEQQEVIDWVSGGNGNNNRSSSSGDCKQEVGDDDDGANKGSPSARRSLAIWCSTLQRTIQTAGPVAALNKFDPPIRWRCLAEIEVGVCDGLTYAQVEEKFPEEFAARKADKLRYRYPRGESYQDVIERLEPILFELERLEAPVLLVGHQALLRCLFAYFEDIEAERIPYVAIPLHTVIRLVPQTYGCEVTTFELDPVKDDH